MGITSINTVTDWYSINEILAANIANINGIETSSSSSSVSSSSSSSSISSSSTSSSSTSSSSTSSSSSSKIPELPLGVDQWTVSLAHMEYANDYSGTFDDASLYNVGFANIGNHVLAKTAEKAIGTSSAYFNHAEAELKQSSTWGALGTGDFTFEMWINFESLPTSGDRAGLICKRYANNNQNQITCYWTDVEFLTIAFNYETYKFTYVWTPTLDTWYHIAWVRDSNNFYTFIDGIKVQTDDITGFTGISATQAMRLGNITTANVTESPFNGYIDEFRCTVGVARWDANFTLREEPYLWDGVPDNRSGFLYAHWSADTVSGGAGQVPNWPDQFSTKDLVQATSASQPTLELDAFTGGNLWGDLPGLRFDAVSASWMQVAYGETVEQNWTMFIVYKLISDNNETIVDGINAAGQSQLYNSSGDIKLLAGSVYSTGTAPDTDIHVLTIYWAGWGTRVYQDGVQISGSANAGSEDPIGLTVGVDYAFTAGQYADAYIQEIMVYAGEQYSGNKPTLNIDGLKYKWGI